ncbi:MULTISPECIES: TetR/AcrR family transcriptional regulator [Nocardiopsis]|jgi:AcrR family transcriptional regulator|uniref:TetR family transcriptional regulator n=1 Tax=Nocardiopsis sinuspersici TaxID=501010 RepID=A0A1V3C3E2_9ACTN|nr:MULTISPECIES: TetR/AcrR family transcriptional regulator [Nocardiopsis]OOC54989.1 TetR family transcriptional regulator [Nocardiopsis sinuspersici]
MVKSAPSEEETRTRARTRRAILEAAVLVLGENAAAPLSQVAEAAGVARSTLQRYFAERADLVRALGEYADELVNEATERARVTEGTGLEAFRRLVPEYFGLQRVIMLAFGNEESWDEVSQDECGAADRALYALVERGHADGSIDPRITPAWAQQLMWAGLYAAWTHVNSSRTPAYEVLNLCVYSLVKAVANPARDDGRA